jgi:hypothetical protein
MTRRALTIGIFGAIIFAVGGRYINAYVPGPQLVRGHLPISVFGLLILFAIVLNPALGRIRPSWRFKGSEIALVMALLLAVSAIIDAGLMRYFPSVCIWGEHVERTTPAWQKARVLDYVPPIMVANDGKYSPQVVDAYLGTGDRIVWPTPWYAPWNWELGEFGSSVKRSWDRVPWAAWSKPLLFWGGMLALSYAAVTSLSVMVHRQWARRERIRYPLAEIISSLLVQDRQGRTAILRNTPFWVGFGAAMFISMLNLIMLWFPNSVNIPLRFDFQVLTEAFPKFMQTSGAGSLANFKIYPAAVGIAFLLASDIGFGLGISNVVAVFALYFLFQMGVDTSGGGSLEGGVVPFVNFGAYFAYTLMLIYIGRKYYWHTAKQAFTFVPQSDTDSVAANGLRVFVFCIAALVTVLSFVGMPWHVALVGVLLAMMIFFVLARLNAEAGTFFCQPSWSMAMVLFCLYGFGALGAKAYLGMSMVMYVLIAGTFECLMPFVVNGLKVTTDNGLKAGRVGLMIGATVIVAMGATVFLGLWSDYQHGISPEAGRDRVSAYQVAERNIQKLELAGRMEASKGYTDWQRLVHIEPDKRFLGWAAAGFLLVFAFSTARLRWARWPLHPVILLTFGSVLMGGRYGASLLLGWGIRTFTIKLAGPTIYMAARPALIGVIVGDILGGFITMAALSGYYLLTGTQGPSWQFW